MQFFKMLLQVAAATSTLLLAIGLFKPWVVLWWEDVQNRKKVLLLYGSVGVALWLWQLLL